MIDFPASPTTNQTFYAASNGVTYMWTGTIWVAAGAGTSAGGDFFATGTGGAIAGSDTALVPNTVITGNSTASYSTSTGRYTPPVGRYSIFAFLQINNSTGSGMAGIVSLYKNGVAIPNAIIAASVGASVSWPFSISATVDANGTDFFELRARANAAATASSFGFGGFPISGIKGPPGDPGQLGFRLLQRTVVSSVVASVDIISIASDINDLKFTFDLTPVTNAQDLLFRFYDSTGVLEITSVYSGSLEQTWNTIASGAAPTSYGQATIALNTAIPLNSSTASARISNHATLGGIRGTGTVPNIRATGRAKSVDWQSNYFDEANTLLRVNTGSAWRSVAGAITGIRLQFTSGNIASGAFSVWGSP